MEYIMDKKNKKQIEKNDISLKLNETILDLEYYLETQFDIADAKESEAQNKSEEEQSKLLKIRNKILKRLNLIVSWLSQWLEYIKFEKHFNPNKLKRYLYGEIIYVNLGFNVGQEFGGPHYALVLNKKDNIGKGILTIVPLSSLKDKDKNKLGDRLYLGNEIKKSVSDSLAKSIEALKNKIVNLIKTNNIANIDHEVLMAKLEYYKKQLEHNKAVEKHLEKLKDESIALTNQITTISKMRILNPKTTADSLSNIRISKKTMKAIMQKIHHLYG